MIVLILVCVFTRTSKNPSISNNIRNQRYKETSYNLLGDLDITYEILEVAKLLIDPSAGVCYCDEIVIFTS